MADGNRVTTHNVDVTYTVEETLDVFNIRLRKLLIELRRAHIIELMAIEAFLEMPCSVIPRNKRGSAS